MFGYKCIKQWLNSDNRLSRRCPQCKAKASIRHIRFLYANKVSSKVYLKIKKIHKRLKRVCYRMLLAEKALTKQKQKTKKYKKMYKASVLAVIGNPEFYFPDWIVSLSKYFLTTNM
jgi:hypothetical protein